MTRWLSFGCPTFIRCGHAVRPKLAEHPGGDGRRAGSGKRLNPPRALRAKRGRPLARAHRARYNAAPSRSGQAECFSKPSKEILPAAAGPLRSAAGAPVSAANESLGDGVD